MTIAIVGPRSYIAESLVDALEGIGKNYTLISLRKRSEDRYNTNRRIFFAEELTSSMVLDMGISSVVVCTSLNAADCEKDPTKASFINIEMVLRVIELLVGAGVKRCLYLSTVKVYGEDLVGEIKEESPVRPSTIYARTHYEAEVGLKTLGTVSSVEVLILRLSNVFGAPMRKDHSAWSLATNCFARQMAEKGSISVKSPDVVRNLLPMETLIRFIKMWVSKEFDIAGVSTVNIGGCNSMSMRRIGELVEGIYSRRINEISGTLDPQVNQSTFKYSVDKMQKLMGVSRSECIRVACQELKSLCEASRRVFG